MGLRLVILATMEREASHIDRGPHLSALRRAGRGHAEEKSGHDCEVLHLGSAGRFYCSSGFDALSVDVFETEYRAQATW